MKVKHNVKVIGQDFTKVKKVVVPMQSMTLREIIKRFMRKESLPVEKEGIYKDDMGDLEKIAREDITVQMERVENLKKGLSKTKKAEAEKAEAKKKAEAAKLEADRLGGPVLTQPKDGKSAGGGGAGEVPPKLA